MNRNNLDQHQLGLIKFVESKHKDTYFYLAPKGGFYYIIYIQEQKFIANKMVTTNFT